MEILQSCSEPSIRWHISGATFAEVSIGSCILVIVTGQYRWLLNIGSGNGLLPSSNKPLPELMLSECLNAISQENAIFKIFRRFVMVSMCQHIRVLRNGGHFANSFLIVASSSINSFVCLSWSIDFTIFFLSAPWLHQQKGKTTTGSALDGAVLDFTQILAYLVHNMNKSQFPRPQLVVHAVYHQEHCSRCGQLDVKYSGKVHISVDKIFLFKLFFLRFFSVCLPNIYFNILRYLSNLDLLSFDESDL